jgi:hypothetical protein
MRQGDLVIRYGRRYVNGKTLTSVGTTMNPLQFIPKPDTDWEARKDVASTLGSKAVDIAENPSEVKRLLRRAIKMIWKNK